MQDGKTDLSSSPLDCSVFVTAGNDETVKVWELFHDMVRPLYTVKLGT